MKKVGKIPSVFRYQRKEFTKQDLRNKFKETLRVKKIRIQQGENGYPETISFEFIPSDIVFAEYMPKSPDGPRLLALKKADPKEYGRQYLEAFEKFELVYQQRPLYFEEGIRQGVSTFGNITKDTPKDWLLDKIQKMRDDVDEVNRKTNLIFDDKIALLKKVFGENISKTEFVYKKNLILQDLDSYPNPKFVKKFFKDIEKKFFDSKDMLFSISLKEIEDYIESERKNCLVIYFLQCIDDTEDNVRLIAFQALVRLAEQEKDGGAMTALVQTCNSLKKERSFKKQESILGDLDDSYLDLPSVGII